MILIAVGANLPGPDGVAPIETCRAAIGAMAGLPGLKLLGCSGWWQTAAIPAADQPPYINAVAAFDGAMAPGALLAELHRLERRFGRRRSVANAARTLDLDIIAMHDLVQCGSDLVLPHPRAHLRAFVLEPLLEVAPDWRHPVTGRSGAELLAALPDQPRVRIRD